MDEDFRTLDLKELYNIFVLEMDDEKEGDREAYNEVRYGVNLKFDIYDFFNGVVKVKEKTGVAIYKRKLWKLDKLWTELEKRRKIIYNWVTDQEEEIMKPRIKKQEEEDD